MDTNEIIGEMVDNPKVTLFKMAIPTFVSFGCILLNLFIDSSQRRGIPHARRFFP